VRDRNTGGDHRIQADEESGAPKMWGGRPTAWGKPGKPGTLPIFLSDVKMRQRGISDCRL